MKGFTFYGNYYELIKYLPDTERHLIYDSIFKYMFEDVEPELDGLLKGIWINIKMPLDTSKNNSIRSIGKGAPIGNKNALKTNQKQTKNKPMENQKQTNNISYFLFLISNNKYKYINKDEKLNKTIKDWLEYKAQRNESYKEKGLESLLSQIENQCEAHGVENVTEIIESSMACNYKGIIFDRIKNLKPNPNWMNKEIKKQELTDGEKEELENLMKEFK